MTRHESGYGRYDDDPEHVGCPYAKGDMTPCMARDGHTAVYNEGRCVGCDHTPAHHLKELGVTVAANPKAQADALQVFVREITEPVQELNTPPPGFFTPPPSVGSDLGGEP